MRYLLAASFVLWLHLSGSASAGPPGSVLTSPFANPDWSIADVSGNTYRPWTEPQTQAVVLVFIGTNCPVSNYYQPTLRGLRQKFAGPGVAWFLVHTDPQTSAARALEHARDFSITAPVVLDPQHALARAAGATKLPQAAVITRDGQVAYLGRIDDTYVGYGKKRAQPSQLDLQNAITAVLSGRPVAVPRTESVGCFIPFATGTAAAP